MKIIIIVAFSNYSYTAPSSGEGISRIPLTESSGTEIANIIHNNIYFKKINNDDELHKFLNEVETPSPSSSISDWLSKKSCDSAYEVFSYSNIDVGYYLKGDGSTYCFELSDRNLLKNDALKDTKAVEQKELFGECLSQIEQKRSLKKLNVETPEAEIYTIFPETSNEQPLRNSLSSSNATQKCVGPCKFPCCTIKLHDILLDIKEKVTNFFVNEEDRFLEVELRCAITELFYINILISRSLLNLYPQVLENDDEDRMPLLISLGYIKESETMVSHDKNLFSDLRLSFLLKRKKYQDLCKRWLKSTGSDFVIGDTTMMLFQMKIDLINMILFETLLYDCEPKYVKRLRSN